MPETFLRLPAADRRDALEVAATVSGRPVHLLEKDVWVVWAIAALFASPAGEHLVFKGGTSLSKAFKVIRRFSEDVDLTYDIRALAPDLVQESAEALPPTRSQEKRWSGIIRQRLASWVQNDAVRMIQRELAEEGVSAHARADLDRILIEYEAVAVGSGYVRPVVTLEFGARSTGEPCEVRTIVCDAAEYLPDLRFPQAAPRVMHVERTFWEKATAMHVFCEQGRLRGERFVRHWHDVGRLHETGYADAALRRRDLAMAVARHKAVFFAEKDRHGAVIDYTAAVSGALRLIPEGQALEALAADYDKMIADGVLLADAETFDDLIARCRAVERLVNGIP